MKNIVRVYTTDPKSGKEVTVRDPEQIVKVLSKPTTELELDYMEGERCKMGTSRELIGEPVMAEDFNILIPTH